MPVLKPLHLTFPHGLHVGRGVQHLAQTYAHVPSDTLFAALLDVSRMMGIDLGKLITPDGSRAPAFRITSAFPLAGEVRFYPMPLDLDVVFSPAQTHEFGAGKSIKKVRYFSEKLVEQWLETGCLDGEIKKDRNGEWVCKTSIQNGALWLTQEEKKGLPETVWAMETLPHVTVDRITSAPNMFQSERAVFTTECGLWFGAIGDMTLLPKLLNTLGESGLGGERSSGYGMFTFKEDAKKDFQDSPGGMSTYLLSRYYPNDSEIGSLKMDGSAYRLDAVGGWLRTPDGAAQRRKRVWMLCEGSLIHGTPQGMAPDVRPNYQNPNGDVPHPVFRPGFAVGLQKQQKFAATQGLSHA